MRRPRGDVQLGLSESTMITEPKVSQPFLSMSGPLTGCWALSCDFRMDLIASTSRSEGRSMLAA